MKQAPKDVGPAGKKFWKATLNEYQLSEEHDLCKLADACRSRDVIERCVSILNAEGPIIIDKHGNPKRHPAQKIMIDSQAMFLRCIREIGLDIIEDRPPRQYGE